MQRRELFPARRPRYRSRLRVNLISLFGNPTREVANVNGIACTAAACDAAALAIGAAQTASNQSNTDAGNAQSDLQDGITAGRTRASGLLAELDQLLEDTDPRWLAFGFEMPGRRRVPERANSNRIRTPQLEKRG